MLELKQETSKDMNFQQVKTKDIELHDHQLCHNPNLVEVDYTNNNKIHKDESANQQTTSQSQPCWTRLYKSSITFCSIRVHYILNVVLAWVNNTKFYCFYSRKNKPSPTHLTTRSIVWLWLTHRLRLDYIISNIY